MAGNAHILVGCGGSGIKTLTRLNELLAEDHYWRRRINTDIYYVVVDTDQSELQEFEENVHRQLAGCPDKPYILPISLSQGVVTLQPLVNQYFIAPFEGEENPEGQERLMRHWWNRGPNAPFVAPDVRPVTEGAGQCPPVSYFLTWRNLEKLGVEFDELIREIQRRQGGFGSMDVLNFLIIAGLSGGTGRGTWSLIAFKLRQLFEKYGRPAAPRAFLFDSSTFSDIYQAHGDQRLSMRVNSLTGMSELSCWIKNVTEGKDTPDVMYKYNLPNMREPEKEASDVLSVDLALDVRSASPVDHAYMLFSGSERASLDNHNQYYEMVGAGIYAALSKSSIDRAAINSNYPYLGLATAMFEVNAATLRRYFESQARVQATKVLMDSNEALVDAAVAEFLKQTGLSIGVTEDDRSEFRGDVKGTFLQQAIAALNEKCKARLSGLDQALEEDSVEETTRRIRGILAKNEELVRGAIAEAKSTQESDPVTVATTLAEKLFDETKSVVNVRMFAEKLRAQLEEEIEEMPREMTLRRGEDPRILVDDFASRPLPFIMRHFNEGECKKLRELTERAIARVNYAIFLEILGEEYRGYSRRVDALLRNSVDVVTCLQKLEHKFVNERERSSSDHGRAFDTQFSSFDRPEDSLEERFAAKKFYRRELKPVLKENEDLELLSEVVGIERELYVNVRDAIMVDRSVSEAEAYDVRKQMQRRIEQSIRDTVGLPDDFISTKFSIRGVIEKLRLAWQHRLHKKMSMDDRGHLEERFGEFFGFIPKRTSDGSEIEYDFPDDDGFVLKMAASLARTCKPHWRLRQGHEDEFKVVLFVPTALDKEAAEKRVDEMIDDSHVLVEVYPESSRPNEAGEMVSNPFVLLAYSTQGTKGLDTIASLDYWQDESGVTDILVAAERPDGQTIFDSSNNNGIGYIDPLYVKDQEIAKLRWRPWATDESVAEENANRALDGLLYALFPGDGESEGPLKEMQDKLVALNWSMPIMRDKGRERFAFTRLALTWDGTKGKLDQFTPRGWDEGRPVSSKPSINNVYDVLLGTNEESGRIDWRQRLLEEAAEFWDVVLMQVNCAKGSPAYGALMDAYASWLGGKARGASDDDPDKAVWENLLKRVGQMTQG